MVSDGVATCPCLWTDREPCAYCSRIPSDFYDSDAQQLAADLSYELFEFSLLRTRRERQWQRLGHDWLWCLKYDNPSCEVWDSGSGELTRIQGVYRWGHVDPNPTQRLMVMANLNRDRDRAKSKREKFKSE